MTMMPDDSLNLSLNLGESEARFIQSLAHFDQYLGLWMIDETWFRQRVTLLSLGGLEDHIRARQANAAAASPNTAPEPPVYEVTRGGIAVMEIRGAITKYGSSLSPNPGAVRMRQAIREIGRDDAVRGALIVLESPGGAVAGVDELADAIATLGRRKPVHAYIDDLGASAAYWLASQATRITANRMAQVGSIGTVVVVRDYSEADRRAGIRTHVISTGPFKGAGVPGTELTPEYLAEVQRTVNDLNEVFLKSVAKGRGLTMGEVRTVADGRVHLAAGARDLKLIDDIGTLEDAMRGVERAVRSSSSSNNNSGATATAVIASPTTSSVESTTMSESIPTTPPAPAPAASPARPATLPELKAACPTAGADFLMAQIEANATVDQAAQAWTAHLVKENARLQQQLASSNPAAVVPPAAAPAGLPGVATVGNARAAASGSNGKPSASDGPDPDEIDVENDPIGAWDACLEAETKRTGGDKARATANLIARKPELHKSYVLAYNAVVKQRRADLERMNAPIQRRN